MVTVSKIDHVCVAVRSIEAAAALFIDVLGGKFIGGGDNPMIGVRAVQIRLPDVKIELLQPLTDDTWLSDHIDKHGEGLHHITMYSDDVLAAEARLNAHGFATVDTDLSQPSWIETFTRPSATFGVLIQIATPSDPWDQPIPGVTLGDVTAGRVKVLSNVMTWKDSGEQIWPAPE